jgi:hypothetical protein
MRRRAPEIGLDLLALLALALGRLLFGKRREVRHRVARLATEPGLSPPARPETAAPSSPSGRWLGGLALLFVAIAGAAIALGLGVSPPGYAVDAAQLNCDAHPGTVSLLTSTASVDADLSVQVFDYGSDTEEAPRLLLSLHSDIDQDVHWMLIFDGSSRWADPLAQHPTGRYSDFGMGPGTMSVVGDYQIAEGTARVGPNAETERVTEITGVAIGPFFYRSRSWLGYGSKTIVELPAYFDTGTPVDLVGYVDQRGLDFATEVRKFHVGVYLALPAAAQLVRVDFASAPTSQDSGGLSWDLEGGTTEIVAAYTDLNLESREGTLSILTGVLLGFGGGALLTAILLGFQHLASRRGARFII